MLGEHFHLHDCENYFIFILISLACGISIYGYRFPERHFPIKFDIFVDINDVFLDKQSQYLAYLCCDGM